MIKHAFVTGATGFLGVNLIKQLNEDGWTIHAIHRNPVSHPLLDTASVNWFNGSLLDPDSIRKALPDEPFIAFHLAASTAQWKPQFAMQTRTNVEGTQNILDALANSRVHRLIYTSSITTYGVHNDLISEASEQRGAETGLNYAITKLKAEDMVRQSAQKGEADAVILNPCHIIGPWDTHNWIQLFEHVKAGTIPGVPPAHGNFAWVEEVAKAHLTAVEKGRSGENYILGGPWAPILDVVNEMERQLGRPISKKALSPALLRAIEPFYRFKGLITGKEPTLTPDKVTLLIKSFKADDSKAQRELNYQHKSISDIVAETLDWMSKHGND